MKAGTRILHHCTLIAGLALLGLAPAQAAGPAAKLDTPPGAFMAPHKALYDIKMVRKKSGSQVINISGQMFYEWHPGCDAWTTDHRFRLNYEYADTSPLKIVSDFTTYEAFSGNDFSFISRRSRNGTLFEELRGHATIDKGKGGLVTYTQPEGESMELPPGTMFPVAHSIAMLQKAAKEKGFYTATIFDGSDEEGPVEVNTFIGAAVKPAAIPEATARIDGSLLKSPARKVRMAFFPLMDKGDISDYEMDAVLHENGVISDMLVEYGDFTVTQTLTALQKVPAETCHKSEGGDNIKNAR